MRKIKPFGTAKSWRELVKIEEQSFSGATEWVFRGEAEHREPETSLRRVWDEFSLDMAFLPAHEALPKLEIQFMHEFQRNYAIYVPGQAPALDDTIHWLSLMRHFGVPTRLLDFTFSLFIATFFALESPVRDPKPDGTIPATKYKPTAVWAVDKSWLTKHSVQHMMAIGGEELCAKWGRREGQAFRKLFWEQKTPLRTVFTVNPFAFHQRLHVQQGLFLCPGDILMSFEENLLSLEGWEDAVRLFLIDPGCRNEILWKLRQIGTSRESLFPGLEGFAQSLRIVTPLLFIQYEKSVLARKRVATNISGELQYPSFDTNIK